MRRIAIINERDQDGINLKEPYFNKRDMHELRFCRTEQNSSCRKYMDHAHLMARHPYPGNNLFNLAKK